MNKRTKIYGRPEVCVLEQFVYLPSIAVFTNTLNITKLGEAAAKR